MEVDSQSPLPNVWRQALQRDAAGRGASYADPLPERRAARLLAAFLASGLVFMALPGTLLGVWNLIGISSRQEAGAVSAAWIQAHGHAQLFGWVTTFIMGISLYTFPKFRASQIRSVALGWVLLAAWVLAIAARWGAGISEDSWSGLIRLSAALQLAAGCLFVWQVTAPPRESHRSGQAWELLIFGGFAGLIATLTWQLIAALDSDSRAAIAPELNHVFISLALWVFCVPVVLGYAARFLPALAGWPETRKAPAKLTLGVTALAAVLLLSSHTDGFHLACLIAALAGCLSLGVFRKAPGRPKTRGVYAGYPFFVRTSFLWLLVSAALGLWAGVPGMLGASRHAFTVGFLSMLIFSLGPRILPSFVNSRELRSPTLMRISLYLLTVGCTLRVLSEPLAYAEVWGSAWRMLPVSAVVELCAVLLFALNMGWTLATPYPVWINPTKHIHPGLTVYWLITSYPQTRALLVRHGLRTLSHAPAVPKSLTLREAVEADGADTDAVLKALRSYLGARLAKALQEESPASAAGYRPLTPE